jgi:hypothetical protein
VTPFESTRRRLHICGGLLIRQTRNRTREVAASGNGFLRSGFLPNYGHAQEIRDTNPRAIPR